MTHRLEAARVPVLAAPTDCDVSGALGAEPRFPGIPATADGSEAVVWVETQVSQGACAYPITSSTNMGAGYQAAQAAGKKNLWGEPLFFLELESEHSAASTCEGFALAGGRVTNFTSGQGLVLMKEVLYTIAGKRPAGALPRGSLRSCTSAGRAPAWGAARRRPSG